MKILANISRILSGIVFIFSGFVKGVDPMGTAYKIQDYLVAYNLDFLNFLAIGLSIVLCAIEFTIGFMLLFNFKIRFTAWILLIMMIFFTGLTLYDAIYEPVSDCGCFGDAIKLTNWQTFYKNIVLIAFAIIVFIYRKKFTTKLHPYLQTWFAVIGFGAFVFFSGYNFRHLPVVDFLEWKVGNKLYNENPQPVKTFLTYKNINTGEEKEYVSPDFPYNDSIWMSQWEFVKQRTEDPNKFPGKMLMIFDTTGINHTDEIKLNPDYQLIITIYDIENVPSKAISKIQNFIASAKDKYPDIAIITGADDNQINDFSIKNSIESNFYNADDVILKTMVRSNPGFMLIKNGEILKKWHYRDFPNYENFIKKWK